MKNKLKYLRKYYFPLIVIFLFSNVKAESFDSAFTGLYTFQGEIVNNVENKIKKAEKLYKEGNYTEALEVSLSLLKEDNVIIQIKTNLLLSRIFKERAYLDKSRNYAKEALRIVDNSKLDKTNFSLEFKSIEAKALITLSKIYIEEYEINKRSDSAYYFLDRLLLIESVNDKISFSKTSGYMNFSAHEFLKKRYKKAEEYALKAIVGFKELDREDLLPNAYLNLANTYVVTNKRELALKTYIKALPYVEGEKGKNALETKELLYYNIAWTMYKLKDYKAFEYLEKSYNLKDSLVDIGLRKELKKIEQIHNVDIIRKEAENKRKVLERNNWLIGAVGLAVSLLFLYLANLNKLKEKDLKLKLSLKGFEQQKKLDDLQLESQAKILNATIDGKESERKQIAETLHDNVSALLSSANMHLQASEKHFGENPPIEIEKTKRIITEASEKIRDLSHNLVSSVLLKFGLEYALKDTAKKYSNSTIKIHTAISGVERYSQEFEIKIYNIIQELINNVLKHSEALSAFIVMEAEEDKLLIIIKDNGIGFKKKKLEDAGIGLNQIEARVRIMDGTFNIESLNGKGTKVSIEVPITKRKQIIHV